MAVPVAHFSHPQHELKLRTKYHLPRFCDLCREKIASSGYSCHRRLCDFDLHEECAKYPETLRSFFAHPWHDLTLSRTDGRRFCDLCLEEVPADVFLYRCVPCGFDVHPRCSRLPQTARSELHPEHGLTTLPGVGTCAACRELCGVWIYRCGLCNFDLHIECLHGARASTHHHHRQQQGGVVAWRQICGRSCSSRRGVSNEYVPELVRLSCECGHSLWTFPSVSDE